MSWFVRFTRYASVHMVYAQEKPGSCGVASCIMINFKLKKAAMMAGFAASAAVSGVPVVGSLVGTTLTQAALDYAVKTEPYVYQVFAAATGSPFDPVNGGMAGDQYPPVLRNLGLGEWEHVDCGETGVAAAIKAAIGKGAPVLARIRWDGGGGHATVIDEVHGDKLCLCDPYDGEVRIIDGADGQTVRYEPGNSSVWSFSIGGTRYGGADKPYGSDALGKLSGWIVRRK